MKEENNFLSYQTNLSASWADNLKVEIPFNNMIHSEASEPDSLKSNLLSLPLIKYDLSGQRQIVKLIQYCTEHFNLRFLEYILFRHSNQLLQLGKDIVKYLQTINACLHCLIQHAQKEMQQREIKKYFIIAKLVQCS